MQSLLTIRSVCLENIYIWDLQVEEIQPNNEGLLKLEDKCSNRSKQRLGSKKKIVYANSRFPPEKEPFVCS